MATPTFTLAGVDGCKGGWIAALSDQELRKVSVHKVTSVAELMSCVPTLSVVAVDIPIGLPDENQPRRECDLVARNKLGPTLQSRVFFSPYRFLFGIKEYRVAVELCHQKLGKGSAISLQAFNILPKIEEVDSLIRGLGQQQQLIREVHPEISFWCLNHQQPIVDSKDTEEGKEKRGVLLEKVFTSETIDRCNAFRYGTGAAIDDLYDALAALWSARRIAQGVSEKLPKGTEQIDAFGLRMEINF